MNVRDLEQIPEIAAMRERLERAIDRSAPEREEHLERVLLVAARAKVRGAIRRGASVAQALATVEDES